MKNLNTVKKEIAEEIKLTIDFIAESKKRNNAFDEGLKRLADKLGESERLKKIFDELTK